MNYWYDSAIRPKHIRCPQMPLLSVIVPVHKPITSYLVQSVISLIDSTPKDSEIHVGLDGLCDAPSRAALEEIRSQFKHIKIHISVFPRQGLVKTLNRMIECSDCTYIARHDSDDVSLPRRFDRQLVAMQLQPHMSFCGTQITRCNKDLKPYIQQRWYPTVFGRQLMYAALLNNPIAHPTLMIKRDLFDSYQYQEINGAEDWDLYVRLWQEGHMSFNLRQRCLLYRIHSQQITRQSRNSQLIRELKSRSLQASLQHFPHNNRFKLLQMLGNASRVTEIAISAKRYIDR